MVGGLSLTDVLLIIPYLVTGTAPVVYLAAVRRLAAILPVLLVASLGCGYTFVGYEAPAAWYSPSTN